MFFVVSFLLSAIPAWIFFVWAVGSFPWLARGRPARRTLAIALVVLCLIGGPLQWLAVHTHSAWIIGIQTLLGLVFVTLALGALPLLAIHLACVYVRPRADEAPRETMTRRQIVEASAGAALFGAVGAAIGWGMVRGRHAFELREIAVRIPGLPRALDGYVIAQISDIHTGAHVGERELEEGLSILRRTRPDLVVVTGDLVDIDPAFAPLVARKLADLPSRDGVFACLGNHDYYAGADAVASIVRAAGVTPLVNDGRVLRARDGGGFALLGVDDLTAKRYRVGAGPRLDLALAAVPAGLPRILLSHQPPTVDMWAGQVALQLSGHTHGGQINPGGRTLNLLFEYVAGTYEVGGTTLYVNRGFGTVGPPARIGVPPEVTRIVLVAA
jgi:predicted MPP superfamily phosphohydrolase